jgi:hypothetical protein
MVTHLASKYAEQALEYYVVARFSALAGFTLIAGNLYHHAVEMILKSRLSETHTTAELIKWSHNLQKLWPVYLKERGNPSLDKFNGTIQELNEFESIRYPEKVINEGAQITFSMTVSERPTVLVDHSGAPKVPTYHLSIQELDLLIAELFAASSLSVAAHMPIMRHGAAKYLHMDNQALPEK